MSFTPHQQELIDLLLEYNALRFGEFMTKSGRKSPYFFNAGMLNTGNALSVLGKCYAQEILNNNLQTTDIIFGPAYKGVPLSVATVTALERGHQISLGYAFDRKEEKDHGEGGGIVGTPLTDGASLLIVEDVITAGLTLKSLVPKLRSIADISIKGVLITLDRAERGDSERSAVQEVTEDLEIPVYPILTVHDILSLVSSNEYSDKGFPPDIKGKIESYLEQYGVS